jgi:hypothetical protein
MSLAIKRVTPMVVEPSMSSMTRSSHSTTAVQTPLKAPYNESIAAAVLGFAAVLFLWGSKHIGDSMLPGIPMLSKKATMGILGLLMMTTCVGLSAKLANEVTRQTASATKTAEGLSYTSVTLFSIAWLLMIGAMFAPSFAHKERLAAASGVMALVAASCTAALAGDIASG